MLSAKTRVADVVEVDTPFSVEDKEFPKNYVIVTVDKNGRKFFSMNSVELKTILHKEYKYNKLKPENIILRVDYIIDEPIVNISNPQLNEFSWNSGITKSTINNSLYESVRNSIQEVKPGGIIYSYFIKLNNKASKK
jgi:hypothetical protein